MSPTPVPAVGSPCPLPPGRGEPLPGLPWLDLAHGHPLVRQARAVAAGRVAYVLCPVTQHEPALWSRPRHVLDAELAGYWCLGQGAGMDVIAVNQAVADWPHELAHAVSLHGDAGHLGRWIGWRLETDRPCVGLVTHATTPGVARVVWHSGRSVPSSGMLGLLVAIALGYPLVLTNASLSLPHYHGYRPQWQALHAELETAGLAGRVAACAPATGPSWVTGLLGPATARRLAECLAVPSPLAARPEPGTEVAA